MMIWHRTTWSLTAALALAAFCLPQASASVVTVTTDVLSGNDGSVLYTGREQTGPGGSPTASSWSTSTSGTSGSVIGISGSYPARITNVFAMLIRLPELPTGMKVGSAQLDVYLEKINETPTFNADLWGLGYRSTNVILGGTITPSTTTGFFNDVDGDGDPGPGTAVQFSDTTDLGDAYGISSRVKLMDNMITPSSTPSDTTPISTTGSALADFIQSLYDNGAVGGDSGDFVVLRLSPDSDVDSTANTYRYEMRTNNDDPASGAVSPALTIEFVPIPEPASMLLLGLGLAMVASRRR